MKNEFFDATKELNTIYTWARARYAAPWGVLGGVLLRVSVSTGPEVRLPGLIGGQASLNLAVAFCSPSGGGKGITDKVSRAAWPTPILERPLGSGEGIAEVFRQPREKEEREHITRALISVPEIDQLAGTASRQGSTILATLKAALMGELLGQTNASAATTRIVEPHTYRLGLSIGAQPGHTGVLFNDTTGGTPQRILWMPTTDPTMPAEAPAEPAPLNTKLPAWKADNGAVEITYGPAEISHTIISAHLARQRGEADALDGHAMLTRCKVAALLAILHQRSVVSEMDWQLSASVMAMSNTTREWMLNEAQKIGQAANRARAHATADREEIVSDRKLQRARDAVLRWLGKFDELSTRDLRPKLKAEIREYLDSALAELADEGRVEVIQVQLGTRYRLAPKYSGVPEVQPLFEQVSDAVPKVQRCTQSSSQCEEKPSSSNITLEVEVIRPDSPPAPKLTKKQVKSMMCKRCSVILPAASTGEFCDDCDGVPESPVPTRAEPEPAAVVVHSEAIAKRNYERRRAG
ncbi:Uncharacterised protein [Mycobacteroides abscessus subsp. abscessus]|uniref:flagellar basal body-associated FliL family protein n=2 Tax=Mycobacteroides abscessus TaxID=36809 RepID=UPI000926E700|nr:flagellar basal body-associated FliL family protein [Mycobacteroides abscessus]QOF32623.1 hypothetical protein E3G57_001522 [Mycobacteroides abscessus]SHX03430.1 bifunctional DNA primase/polymerase domain protein [Mycobacteroides abscessus subsp. abscessus]SII07513.1 Uncharacterised protein [Mycobacteroides abscessus subsp. abscessus]SKD15074.1 bifunctional DNA primase/polymerase domain protein [Mycobacteroides abscessus subsp. abscessus]SKL98498.1 Uncharacterised protein [Mycobacteroides a